MPVGSLLPQLLASGQVPEDILRQMEAARDPGMGFSQPQGGGFVQRGNEQPMFIPPAPQQQVNPATAPRMGENPYPDVSTMPTVADLVPEGMHQSFLRSLESTHPGISRFPANRVPLQVLGKEWEERYWKGLDERQQAWKDQQSAQASELALKREDRLARSAEAREKAADARMRRLEEGRPLTVTELREVRTDIGNMEAAELALNLLEGKNVKGMVGDKNATGWKGFLPDFILQRADPMGVDARAALSNIGSLRAQERSGGAIPAHEWERIKGFIPTDTDDPVTARKKLRQFIDEYQRALRNHMSSFEGRKVPPGLRRDIERRARPSLEELLGGQRN